MGNQQPSNQKNQPLIRSLDKIKLDVACLKVKGYLELNRDRKVNEALNREKVLNACIRSAQRVRVDEYQKLAVLVSDVNYIEACNLVIRCVDIVKDQSFRICGSNGDATKIPDMIPFIETVCFAASHLNLQAVIEFRDMMAVFFGMSSIDPNSLQGVDPELRVLFKSTLPDAMDINAFALRFAEKYGITEQELNVPGHKFSSLCLLPPQGGPSQQGGFSPQQGGFQQPQGGFQQGQGFPQQQGGYQQPNQPYQQPNQPYGGMNIQIHLDNPNGGAQFYNATVPQNFGQPQPSNNFGQGQQGYGGNPYGGNGVNPYGGNQNNQGQQNQNQYQPPHNDHPPQSNQFNNFAPQNNQYQQPHNDFPPQNNAGNNYGVQAPNSYQPNSMSNQNQQVPNQQNNQPSNYAQTPQPPQQPQYPQTPQPNQGQQPTGQQPHVGNPMGGDDLDDLEARFNRLKNGL